MGGENLLDSFMKERMTLTFYRKVLFVEANYFGSL